MLIQKKKKGQSTVEYIVLVTAVIIVVVLFVFNKDSLFQKKINTTYDTVTTGMTDMASRTTKMFNGTPLGPKPVN